MKNHFFAHLKNDLICDSDLWYDSHLYSLELLFEEKINSLKFLILLICPQCSSAVFFLFFFSRASKINFGLPESEECLPKQLCLHVMRSDFWVNNCFNLERTWKFIGHKVWQLCKKLVYFLQDTILHDILLCHTLSQCKLIHVLHCNIVILGGDTKMYIFCLELFSYS